MAFDQELAGRVRAVLAAAGQAPAEKKMFGGLSFLIAGNICCGVVGEDLLVRLGAETASSAPANPAARPFDMGRGPSPEWVVIGPGGTATGHDLAGWVTAGASVHRNAPCQAEAAVSLPSRTAAAVASTVLAAT